MTWWTRPRHEAVPRGVLKPALELYLLCPGTPPDNGRRPASLGMGEAVYAYVERLLEAGLVCPFAPRPGDATLERTE